MPLHIDRVETEMEVTTDRTRHRNRRSWEFLGSEEEIRDRLRPLVLEILEEELERLRRELG